MVEHELLPNAGDDEQPNPADRHDGRTIRAVEQPMQVLDINGFPIKEEVEGGICTVISSTEYRVDLTKRRQPCTCPDSQHRQAQCKHYRRAMLATGREPLSLELVADADIDSTFAENAPGPQAFAEDAPSELTERVI